MPLPAGPEDETEWWHWVEVHLALAFGHIKKAGSCSEPLWLATLAVLETERARAEALTNWAHRDD